MDLLAAWLLFPLLAGLLFLGWGLIVERISGRELPGVLLLPVGLAAVLVVCRVLVVWTVAVDAALPFLALVAVVGLVLSRARLRALRFDPWAAAAAAGVALVIAGPVILSGEPTFTGPLVLGDTAHQLTLAARLGESGTALPPPHSSYDLSVRKYFVSAYPIGPQATLGILSPLGLLDLAWLYLPFLALLAAAAALALNGLIARSIESRRARGLVTFVAGQPALVVAFALQGSIKEITAVATVTLTFALVLLAIVERWPARAFLAPALAALATVGALGPPGLAYVGPPLAIAAGAWALRLREVPLKTALPAAAAVVLASALLALPVLSGAGTAVKANDTTLSTANQLGNLARPLDPLQASGAWVTGDYRYEPIHPHAVQGIALLVCLAGLLGLVMAVRRRALGPLLLAGVLLPISALLLLRGNPYADAKVLVLVSVVVPLLAMSGAAWLLAGRERRLRLLGGAVAVGVGVAVIASNAAAYHKAQLAPYHRYQEQLSIGDQLKGRGPVVFAEYDEFAKYFVRHARVLSVPEWPFEYPVGRLNPTGAASRMEGNRRLHPTFKTALDPDGIDPSILQNSSFIVLRRSPTTSRPPADYRLIRTSRYYEVWQRDRSLEVLGHAALGRDVFEPASRPSCDLVAKLGRRAERSGAQLASVERDPVVLFDPVHALRANRGLDFASDKYELFPKSVTVPGAGRASASLRVPKTGRYRVWLQGSFSRALDVRLDGRPVGTAAYEIAYNGAYLLLGNVNLRAGRHELLITRGKTTLHPGDGGELQGNVFMGPTVLSPVEADRRTVRLTQPRDARALCSKRLDWIEIVRPARS